MKSEIELLKLKLVSVKDVKEELTLLKDLADKLLFTDLEESKRIANKICELAQKNNFNSFYYKGKLLFLNYYRALSKFDQAKELAEKLLLEEDKILDYDDKFILYNTLVIVLSEKLEFDKAKEYSEYILFNIYDKISKRYQAYYHIDNGKVNEKCSLIDLAIEEYEKGLIIFEEIDDSNGKAKTVFLIGILYHDLGKFKKALPYFEKTLEIDLKINNNNPIIVLQSYVLIAKCLLGLGKHSKGLKNLEKALKLAELSGSEVYLNRMNTEKVLYYNITKQPKKAVKLAENLLKLKDFQKDSFFYNQTLFGIGTAYLEIKETQKAIRNLKKCLKTFKKNNQVSLEKRTYFSLFEAYKYKKDHAKALEYHILYSTLNNKIQEDKEKNALEQFEIKYKTKEKEKESEKHKTESLKFQLQSLRSQMNPHFVFNAISSISSHLKEDNIENSKHLLNSFARLMRSNLEFAETEKISLEEEIKFLKDYLNLEKNRLANQFEFEIVYDADIDLDFIEIPSMLLQPYVENAIKHGIMPLEKEGFIEIKFKEKEDILECTITDNGIGRNAAAKKQENKEKHLGKSTKITETRLDLLNQKSKDLIKVQYFDVENEKGTRVEIKINL